MNEIIEKSEQEWKDQLGLERFRILRQKGTEFPNSGQYNMHFELGTYVCGGCAEPLFESDSKFNSHCGWPSFDDSIPGKVEYIKDTTHGMIRTEIVCAKCKGHLGHIFDDGPTKTRQRYCFKVIYKQIIYYEKTIGCLYFYHNFDSILFKKSIYWKKEFEFCF